MNFFALEFFADFRFSITGSTFSLPSMTFTISAIAVSLYFSLLSSKVSPDMSDSDMKTLECRDSNVNLEAFNVSVSLSSGSIFGVAGPLLYSNGSSSIGCSECLFLFFF